MKSWRRHRCRCAAIRSCAFYLAQSDARAGRFADADAALGALLGEVSAADNPRLRLRILNARGLARIRIGRLQEAPPGLRHGFRLPHAEEFVGELGEAYNGRAIADIALHDFDAGNVDLGRARVQLERAGDALGVARVDANLGLLDYERGALAQAEVHLRSAIQRFEAFASARELASALSGLLLVQLAQLQNSAALATSARLWQGIGHTGDPIQKRALVLRRASALLATGALGSARALLDDVVANPGPNLLETRDDERLHLLRTDPGHCARAASPTPRETQRRCPKRRPCRATTTCARSPRCCVGAPSRTRPRRARAAGTRAGRCDTRGPRRCARCSMPSVPCAREPARSPSSTSARRCRWPKPAACRAS